MSDTTNTTTNGTSESEQVDGSLQGKIKATEEAIAIHKKIILEGKEPPLPSQLASLASLQRRLWELNNEAKATGRLENPPAVALDRVALGRLCFEAAWVKVPGKVYWADVPEELKEGWCRAAEAVAAYVLAQTPEPVELDREAIMDCIAWIEKTVTDDHLITCKHSQLPGNFYTDECSYCDARKIVAKARAVLARYAAPAPIATPSTPTDYSELSAAASAMASTLKDIVARGWGLRSKGNCETSLALYANCKAKPQEPAPIAQRPSGVVEALRELVTLSEKANSRLNCCCDAQDGVICTKCRLRGSVIRAKDSLFALPSAGSEGEDWKAKYDELFGWYQTSCRYLDERNKELETMAAKRNHAVELLRVECEHSNSLASERDRCREMNDTLTADRDALSAQVVTLEAERDQLRAEVERLQEYAKGIERCVQLGIKLKSVGPLGPPEAPTPSDPRRVVEGMRVDYNGTCDKSQKSGWTYTLKNSETCANGWYIVREDGQVIGSFVGDTLPSYLDPLPAEPTPPIPEPAGEIVLPEAVKDHDGIYYIWPDGYYIKQHWGRGYWFVYNPERNYPEQLVGKDTRFPTSLAAARALAAIGQGPGAKVETPERCESDRCPPQCPFCNERPGLIQQDGMCSSCYLGIPSPKPVEAQPASTLSIPWRKPDGVYAGDRIIGVYECREKADAPIKPRVVIMVATEDGWDTESERDLGIELNDLSAYVTEKDLLASLGDKPAPPPFDVERLAEVLEECRELIIPLRPLSHRWFTDNRDHHIIGRIDAILAALGGKE